MILLVFLFLIGPIGAQDENSEDAFEIKRDKSMENEGMDTFVMSTALLEPEPSTTMTTAVEESREKGSSPLPEETMAEDPFAMTSPTTESPELSPTASSSSAGPTPEVPEVPMVTTTEQPSVPVETKEEEEVATTVDPNVEPELSTETVVDSTEVDETIPTIADVWTTSTETAERRVLKEKSGEELAKKDLPTMITPETTAGPETAETLTTMAPTTEEITTKASSEAEEEAPFDSSNLSGLFEADGSPKIEEPSPTFPLAHLPPHEQEEQSAEILDKEKSPKMETVTTTEEPESPEEEETTVTTTESASEEETTTTRQRTTTERATTTTEERTTVIQPVKMMEEPQRKVVMRPPNKILTPITLKITSIEWNDDFGANASGKFKKLSEQILPELALWLKNELGDDFIGVEIESFTKGSVVVNALMTTKEPIGDPEQLANRLESTITTGGNRLGGNVVDPATITVNGIPSRAYLDRVNASYTPIPTSPLLVAAIIAVAAVLLILIVVLICLINNRRSHGGMKMGSLPTHVEDSPPLRGAPQLNLMSYANSTRNTGTLPRPDEREVV